MWKYTHTDEMYHSLTNRNNSSELYHSDRYLGNDFSDGIRHFKYIRKVRQNGKWVYYYKDAELDAANKIAEKKRAISNEAFDKIDKASDNRYKADQILKLKKSARDDLINENKKTINPIKKAINNKKIAEYDKEIKKASSNYEKAKKTYDDADKDHEKKGLDSALASNWLVDRTKSKDYIRKEFARVGAHELNKVSTAVDNVKKKINKGKAKVDKVIDKQLAKQIAIGKKKDANDIDKGLSDILTKVKQKRVEGKAKKAAKETKKTIEREKKYKAQDKEAAKAVEKRYQEGLDEMYGRKKKKPKKTYLVNKK